jgi:hypothetical protein
VAKADPALQVDAVELGAAEAAQAAAAKVATMAAVLENRVLGSTAQAVVAAQDQEAVGQAGSSLENILAPAST